MFILEILQLFDQFTNSLSSDSIYYFIILLELMLWEQNDNAIQNKEKEVMIGSSEICVLHI